MSVDRNDKTEYLTPEQLRLVFGEQRRGQPKRKTKPARSSGMPKVLENDIRAAIKETLELYGWATWINWQGPMSFKGVTDLTAIKGGQVWWIEVKRPGGKLRPDQVAFRDLIEEHGGNWVLAESVDDLGFLLRR